MQRHLILSLVLTCTIPPMAGEVREMSLESLTRGSDFVAIGTYSGEYETIVDKTTKMPFKQQTVRISSCPKMLRDSMNAAASPTCPDTVTVRALGGLAPAYDAQGNVIMRDGKTLMLELDETDAMPSLTPGEHVLFLSRQGVPDGQFRLYGSREGMRPFSEQENNIKSVTLLLENWELLSEDAKSSKRNLAIKSARADDDEKAADRTTARVKPSTEAPLYLDTVRLEDVPALIRNIPKAARPNSGRR